MCRARIFSRIYWKELLVFQCLIDKNVLQGAKVLSQKSYEQDDNKYTRTITLTVNVNKPKTKTLIYVKQVLNLIKAFIQVKNVSYLLINKP